MTKRTRIYSLACDMSGSCTSKTLIRKMLTTNDRVSQVSSRVIEMIIFCDIPQEIVYTA
jgi:hypothetical protein